MCALEEWGAEQVCQDTEGALVEEELQCPHKAEEVLGWAGLGCCLAAVSSHSGLALDRGGQRPLALDIPSWCHARLQRNPNGFAVGRLFSSAVM